MTDDEGRGNPCSSEIPERLQEFRGNLVDERVPEHGDSHASSTHEPSSEPQRREVPGYHSVFTHTSRKTEIARSARGLQLQGSRAEDVLVRTYLVQENLVT